MVFGIIELRLGRLRAGWLGAKGLLGVALRRAGLGKPALALAEVEDNLAAQSLLASQSPHKAAP